MCIRDSTGQVSTSLGEHLGVADPPEIDGVVVPTINTSLVQQMAYLETFLVVPFQPDVVVMAVSTDELEPTELVAPRDALNGDSGLPFGFGLELVRMWRAGLRSRVPPGSVQEVERSLRDLATLAERREFRVALYRPEALPDELDRVVNQAAAANDWLVLERAPGESAEAAAVRFGGPLSELLR